MSEDELTAEAVPEVPDDGGRWERIGFMGHVEYTGWVTEIVRNGQPAYRIELPDYVWGGDKDAWVEHSATSWYSSNPVNGRAVRQGWEATRRRRAEIAEWEARQKAQRALMAADDAEADTIAREEAGEDWDAPDRERDDLDDDEDDEEGPL
jgi:hypothetical protein